MVLPPPPYRHLAIVAVVTDVQQEGRRGLAREAPRSEDVRRDSILHQAPGLHAAGDDAPHAQE